MIAILGLILLIAPSVCLGRFFIEDVNVIDDEHRLNTETYNDKLSYRFPYHWVKSWRQSRTGFRINTGSLNKTRLNYSEEVMVQTPEDSPLYLGYYRGVFEDFINFQQSSYLELGFKGSSHMFSILGEGGTFKEYGDLGAAWTYRHSVHKMRLLYWSVDHYYSEKRSHPEDERTRNTYSLSLEYEGDFEAIGTFAWRIEYDHPLRWKRLSEGYTYDYQLERAELRWQRDEAYVHLSHEHKEEGRTWLPLSQSIDRKFMTRDYGTFEAGYETSEGLSSEVSGMQLVYRNIRYQYEHREDPGVEKQKESRPESRLTRYEVGFFHMHSMPMNASDWSTQLGGFVNLMELEQGGKRREIEVKFQYAWEYRIDPTAKILLNTTWDLDQLVRDFPYDKDPFRPWGGGNLQLQMTL